MEPAVLVHLSDIHFTGNDDALAKRNRGVRVELMRDLEIMQQKLGRATAVVVTGDIAFSGEKSQFVTAKAWLDEVARLVGTENCQVLTVPGNHDVNWASITPSARIAREKLRTCPLSDITPVLDELLTDASSPLLASLAHYNEFALGYRCEVASNGLPWEAAIELPHGYHLAVRGLTTVFNSDRDDTEASLVVGRTQTVLPRETPAAVYMLLAHHGPEDCRDRIEIRDRIKGKVHALLCGHRHDERIHRVNDCVEITAGAVHPEEDPGWYPTYNWMRFDVQPTQDGTATLIIDVYQRVLRPEWNEFRSGLGGDQPFRDEQVLPPLSRPPLSAAVAPPAARQPLPNESPVPIGAQTGVARSVANKAPEGATYVGALPARSLRDSDSGTPPSGDGGSDDVPATSADLRPPVVDKEGRVDSERRLTRDLLDLPVPDQEAVLTACGFLTLEDRQKDHVTMILDALARVTDDEARERLADQIAAVMRRRQGRTS